ncbi:molybdopterin molybdotransferase MoeA [Gammaproteobacteria bacterium]|nr:molybdopterin molybdotransferase MoeA [Gammaproteobacteria bacterium]
MGEIAFAEARRRVVQLACDHRHVRPPAAESVTLQRAHRRYLAEPIDAPRDVPGFRASAMDGYSLCAAEMPSNRQLAVVGQSLAGHPWLAEPIAGQAVRVFTGARLPDTHDCVVMQEQCSASTDSIVIDDHAEIVAGRFVRLADNDFARRTRLRDAASRLDAASLSLLASAGIATVPVMRPLTVALFSSGDELQPLGETLRVGGIHDSNRWYLHARLLELGFSVLDLGVVADDAEATRAAIRRARDEADVLISSGGASVGDADFVQRVFHELGAVSFWKVASRPGRPFAFGEIGDCLFFGLPGNPVSVGVCFEQLVKPALLARIGAAHRPPHPFRVPLAKAINKLSRRREFQRGCLLVVDGELRVQALPNQDSGAGRSMAQADCLIVLSESAGKLPAGEVVDIEVFYGHL